MPTTMTTKNNVSQFKVETAPVTTPFTIDKDIPAPPFRGVVNPVYATLDELETGDSFLIPEGHPAYASAAGTVSKWNKDKAEAARKEGPDTDAPRARSKSVEGGLRVWRVA